MRIKLLDQIPGSYTAYPLLVTIPVPANHIAHADDSDIQVGTMRAWLLHAKRAAARPDAGPRCAGAEGDPGLGEG